ncbi:MAG: hypothetical protein Kow00124_16750 [Anaerolineae bacterium]
MNIFQRELKANLRSLITWSVVVVLFAVVGFSKFSAYEGNPELVAILDTMPPAVIEAFQFRAFNLTTVTGFFGVMYSWLALLLSIAAAMWGSGIISKEERDKTVEFALTLPVTRERVVTSKALAAALNCLILQIITGGATLLGVMQYQPDRDFYEFFALGMVALFIVQMVFLAVGLLLGCAMKRYRMVGSVTVSIILVTYFLSLISSLSEDLEFLKYLSPFTYFNPAVLLNESKIDLPYVALSLVIIVVSMIFAYTSYSQRDLYI